MGFLGRYNGLFIKNELNSIYLNDDFVDIKEKTRNCIAILAVGGSRKEILEVGPMIRPAAKRCSKVAMKGIINLVNTLD